MFETSKEQSSTCCWSLYQYCAQPIVSLYRRHAFIAAAQMGDVETIINYISQNKIQSDIDALQQARIIAIISNYINIENLINDVLDNALDNEDNGLLRTKQQPLEYAICNKMENEALALINLQSIDDTKFSNTSMTAYELAAQYLLEHVQIALIMKGAAQSLKLTSDSIPISILSHAYKNKQFKLAFMIISKFPLDSTLDRFDREEILNDAVKTRNFPIILALLAKDPKFKFQNKELLPSHRMLSKIGNGNYGIVSKAEILSTNQHVALKCIKDAETFSNEILILSGLHNDHIVSYLWAFHYNNQYFVAYELLNGLNLLEFHDSHLMSMPINDEKINMISELMNQLLEGLEFLEKHHVIHFDLHTGNIMLHDAGNQSFTVKIIDFGKAREIGKIPMTPLLGGAINFSPPEAFEYTDVSLFSTKYDVFSYGVIAYVMVTSKSPFSIYDKWSDYPERIRATFFRHHFASNNKSHTWPANMRGKYLSFREHVDAALEKNMSKRPLASELKRLQIS